MRLVSIIILLIVFFAGSFAYQHRRIADLEKQLETFQTNQFKLVTEKIENSPTTSQYLELQQQIKQNTDSLTGVRQDIRRIHPGGFLQPDELAEGLDHWSAFIGGITDAEKLAESDPKTARILALTAFEGLGIRCRSRRMPYMAIARVQPLVEDLYSFEIERVQTDWVRVVGKNNGC